MNEHSAKRQQIETIILEKYNDICDRTLTSLINIGILFGDTVEEATKWALKCIKYTNE